MILNDLCRMIQYKKGNKTKTFDSAASANMFTGSSAIYNGDFEYRVPSIDVFHEMIIKYPGSKLYLKWDDGTEMKYNDWLCCVKYLMSNF